MKNKLIIGLFMLSGCATMFSLHNKLDNIGVEVERVHVESIISSGKAIYMPGSVCVIKATSEVDVTKMREFASACINSHNNWLLINSSNTSYSDATEEIQR
jgi:starvation-inducible outer membrane lipoprotein